jgi:hypothetical protein
MPKRKYTKGLIAIMLLALVAMSRPSIMLAQSGAPKIVGDWKLNLAKSTFGSGPPLKGRNLHWEWSGDTLKHTAETMEASGDRTLAHFEGKFDDKDYGVFQNGGKTPARYVRLRRLDDYNIEITSRKDGKDLTTFRHSISQDGKTDTVTQTGDTRQGGSGTDVLVLERR